MLKKCLHHIHPRHYLSSFVLFLALLTACENQSTTQPVVTVPGEFITFTGKLSAKGSQQTMQLGLGHQTKTFRLTGSLMLYGPQRPARGFKADVIGFSDNLSGMQGRSVWTDNFGDKVFSTLQSEVSGTDTLVKGTFIGGTGRYAILTGEYTFKWKRLITSENGALSGRVVDLSGRARLGVADTLPTMTGNQQ